MFEFEALKHRLNNMIIGATNQDRINTILEVKEIIEDLEEEQIQEHIKWAEENGYTKKVE